MRILMLTPYLPYPPSAGGQIRSYNLIKQLSKTHQITLYSLIKFDQERKYVKELEKYCQRVQVFKRPTDPWTLRNILRTGFSALPFLAIRNFSNEEKKDLAQLLKTSQFDIIHAETFYVSPHIPQTKTPIVLVDQTIEYQVYQHYVENYKWWALRPLLWIDILKIKFWETYYWKKAAQVVALSEKDAKVMRQFVSKQKVAIVPNPVGEDLMKEVPLHFSNRIIFMGNYDWLQNVEGAQVLARDIFPKILLEIPDAALIIAGQNVQKVQHLARDRVEILGIEIDNPDGVAKAFHRAGVLVAPLYGPGGSRVKIIGSMAAKLPVVTTNIGIQGIEAKNGQSVLFGETIDDLVNLTVKLLKDKALYKKIANNARRLAEDKYSAQAVAMKLNQVYAEALEIKSQ